MSEAGGAPGAGVDEALRFEVINRVGVITLNRPKALNALSHDMMLAFMPLLDRCERDANIKAVLIRGTGPKAFCAGGDVVAVVNSAREGTSLQRDFFIDEYRVDYRLHRFAKPVVAFMHGIVMGGGMGLSQGASLRLVTDTTRIAMPETRIGLIPDVGATHFFGRMPAPLALYLGLTGVTIHGGDALFVGFADARSRVTLPDELDDALRAITWGADAQSDLRQSLAAPDATRLDGATLPALSPAIYRHFDPACSVAETMASLAEASAQAASAEAEWARTTLELMRSRSPLMLAVCRAALQRGRRMTLAQSFRMEYDVLFHAIACGEFLEGVRAHLIDKDGTPRWQPASIESVTPDRVASFFVSPDVAAGRPHPLADLI
ncbi:enoyl-CoA hydratase/isomerase family protein [Aquabacterium sp.]|uniref:enoyl-CoA hydratase/isomerase family protein n=1 Tax=Aquabacterium sp. TaxID=1872578 RepID=UPI0035B2ED53